MLQTWKHFCFILSTGTRIRIDSVMRRRSSSRGRNTSASVTVTVTNVNGSVQSVTWMRKLCVSVWFIELQNNYNWNWNSKVNQNNSKESTWRIQTFLYQGKSGLDSRSGWPPKFNVDFLVQGLTSMIKFSWRSHQVFQREAKLQKNVLSRNVEESFEKNFLMRIPMTYVI